MDVKRRALLLGGALAAAGAAVTAVPLLRAGTPEGTRAAPDPPGGFDPLVCRLACGWLPEGFRLHQTVLGRHRQSLLGSRPGRPDSFLAVTLYRPGLRADAGTPAAAARRRWQPDAAHWATVELAGAPDAGAAAERISAEVRADLDRPVTLALRTPGLPEALRLQEVLLYQPAAPEGWSCGTVYAPTPVPLDASQPHSSLTISVEPLDHGRHHPIFEADQGAEVTVDGRLARRRETGDREHLTVLDAAGFFVTITATGAGARRPLGREGVVGVFRRLQILPGASAGPTHA
jgi:hypothetical protein